MRRDRTADSPHPRRATQRPSQPALRADIPTLEPNDTLIAQLAELSAAATRTAVQGPATRTARRGVAVTAVAASLVGATTWLAGAVPGVPSPLEHRPQGSPSPASPVTPTTPATPASSGTSGIADGSGTAGPDPASDPTLSNPASGTDRVDVPGTTPSSAQGAGHGVGPGVNPPSASPGKGTGNHQDKNTGKGKRKRTHATPPAHGRDRAKPENRAPGNRGGSSATAPGRTKSPAPAPSRDAPTTKAEPDQPRTP